jgi:hypothetical protein
MTNENTTETGNVETTTTETGSSNRPHYSDNASGGLQVAVWKNRNEAGIDHYTVKLERRYKDANGNFQSTDSLRESDLLRAGKLLNMADDWIEQDRQKQKQRAARER